ncbi:MAG: NAD-dependent epimerase/dehydratase family protein [Phaeodactylibacter sp.]|uniref:NAD-dependent epimerase/dehydratase family protein n=1 Tax=Phaeodactylibacter sp. TaxID=1940289 RepID=UPI0032EDC434
MDKNSSILVTGATGFIGAHLLQQLLADGYTNIRALRRPGSPMDLVEDLAGQVDWADGDILDIFALEEAMQERAYVFHCAAVVSFDPAEAKHLRTVNITGTANVVNTALKLGTRKLLYVSSIAAIGRTKQGITIDETAKWERSPFNTRYAVSKYQGEMEIWRGFAEGLDIAVVNPSIVLGSGFWHSGPAHFFSIVDGGFPFYPVGTTGLVDVRDVAWYMIRLMESDIKNERFILNADHYPYRQLLTEIAKALQVPPPKYKVGKMLRGLFWRLAWLQAKLMNKPPFLTRETARNSSWVFYYDNQKSLRYFDFKYTPIAETIKDTAAAYQKAQGQKAVRLSPNRPSISEQSV